MPLNDLPDFDATTAANNTDVAGANVAEGCAPSGINNAIRNLASIVKRACGFKGSDIASAGTTSIGAASTAGYVDITGTTTITALGTVAAGTMRWVKFEGALTLTHNGTSLILPGAANITTADGDAALFVSEGAGNWRCLVYRPATGKPVVSGTVGKHKLWIPASAMLANPINGPASAQTVGSDVVYYTLDFDATTSEIAQFTLSMPSSWDEGTVTFRPVWTAASGSGGVVWKMFGLARGDGDTLSGGVGTGQTSTDTLLTAGQLHRGPESAAITISDSPAANDYVDFLILRTPADGSDTLAVDARLLGIELYFTTNEAVDVAT
jgi:hypothetical protein